MGDSPKAESKTIMHKVDRTGWGPGPWDDEPDRHEWRHRGLPCLAVRSHAMGAWCFPAGTMILTIGGYRRIEDLRAGDLVLSHRRRWCRVMATGSRWADRTVVLRGHGVPDVRVTPEHPLLTRTVAGPRLVRHRYVQRADRLTAPAWTPAGDAAGRYVAQIEPPTVPDDHSTDLWWATGRFLADGWVTRRTDSGKGYTSWACSHGEAPALMERLRRVFPRISESRRRTCTQLQVAAGWLRDFLAPFGHGAAYKTVPAFALGLPRLSAEAFIEGYFSGDGFRVEANGRQGAIQGATTVSRGLALGMALAVHGARRVIPSLYFVKRAPTAVIEGRHVRQRDAYRLVVPERNNSAFLEGELGWKLIRNVRDAPGCTVFNLSVEDDESYVADGIVAHNCGYCGVPPGHPLHGGKGDELEVHGGITYSAPCQVDGPICHVPLPGEPDDVFWLGYDCGHAFDIQPGLDARMHAMYEGNPEAQAGRRELDRLHEDLAKALPSLPRLHYWTLPEVIAETEALADQVVDSAKEKADA